MATTLCLMPSTVIANTVSYYKFPSIDGGEVDTSQWKGKPYLVVNTASLCGYTKQLEGLQKLYEEYRDQGFEILAVPSNDFNQELGSDNEVKEFCELNYATDMPMSITLHVKGGEAHPFFKEVEAITNFTPKWNFNKILIGSEGQVIGTWGAPMRPMSPKLQRVIEEQLSY
ncbi:glutathione peroxidase [Nereida sp.]|uniref:glutathione peroxidase n=1 Tax=Nereida sp. TaxID=2736090 RepID=UPI003F696FCB